MAFKTKEQKNKKYYKTSKKEYDVQYYNKHRDKKLRHRKEYYWNNKNVELERCKQYRTGINGIYVKLKYGSKNITRKNKVNFNLDKKDFIVWYNKQNKACKKGKECPSYHPYKRC